MAAWMVVAADKLVRSSWILETSSVSSLYMLCVRMEPVGFAAGRNVQCKKTKVSRMTPSFWPEHLV